MRKVCDLQARLAVVAMLGDGGGYGFNVERMGVGVSRRGVEAQPGTGDP